MSDPGDDSTPKSEPGAFHRRFPYGPGYSRLLWAGGAVVGGIILAIKCLVGGISGDSTLLLVLSLVLVVLGIAGLFLARWMAKRGH